MFIITEQDEIPKHQQKDNPKDNSPKNDKRFLLKQINSSSTIQYKTPIIIANQYRWPRPIINLGYDPK